MEESNFRRCEQSGGMRNEDVMKVGVGETDWSSPLLSIKDKSDYLHPYR